MRRIQQRAKKECWPKNGNEFLPPVDIQLKLMNSALAPAATPGELPRSDLRPVTADESAWITRLAPTFEAEDRSVTAQVRRIAEEFGCNQSTVWNRRRKLRKTGRVLRKKHANKGQTFLATHERERTIVESAYLEQGLSISQAWRILRRECPNSPGYETVRTHLVSLPKPITTLARDGEKAFNDRCSQYLIRDHSKVPVMDCAISDDMQHDVWTFDNLWTGEAARLWLTAIMEMRSRKVIGYAWCTDPSSHSIGSALRPMLLNFGVTRTFYIDNGKPQKKSGRIGLSPETSGMLVRLGSRPVYALPYSPQSKGAIEKFFGTVHQNFDCLWKRFYCGRSPSERPEDCSEILHQHELYKKGKLERSPLPLASEFVQLAAAWIEEYNERQHCGQGMNGRTPNQVFDEGYPVERRQPVDPRMLDQLLWDRVKRRISEGGCVTIDNARYEPADPQGQVELFTHIGRDVLIARDPYNLGEAIAISDDGRFLGELRAQQLLTQGPTSYAEIRESMRQRRQLRRGVKDYLAYLAVDRKCLGIPTELEALRQRAGVAARATGTDGAPVLPAAAPGARQLPRSPAYVPDSPFVDDAAAKCIAELRESGFFDATAATSGEDPQ